MRPVYVYRATSSISLAAMTSDRPLKIDETLDDTAARTGTTVLPVFGRNVFKRKINGPHPPLGKIVTCHALFKGSADCKAPARLQFEHLNVRPAMSDSGHIHETPSIIDAIDDPVIAHTDPK